MQCPNCENNLEFLSEQNPFGWTQCTKCKYKAEHKQFNMDFIERFKNEYLYKTAAGLHVKSKRTDDYIILSTVNNKLAIDGEIKYINSIDLEAKELDMLIYELVEIRKQLR